MELRAHGTIPRKKPVLVCVLDGWGENAIEDEHNAVHVAKTPTMDGLKARGPSRYRTVKAHGTAVGLPTDADMGNSEVGHNALGAGKVIAQGASLVDIALETKNMFSDAGWSYIKPAFANNTLHIIALLSDGGVHSRTDQIFGMMRGAVADGCKRLRVHPLTDGRDVADGTCHEYMEKLVAELDSYAAQGCDAKVASGGGRMAVTMDRYEADWAMVERGWRAHVLGDAPNKFTCPKEALKELKKDGTTDQYIAPFVIVDEAGKAVGTIEDDDAVVIGNFRADRVVEISKAFEYADFNEFDRVRFPKTKFVGLMQYDGDLKLPANYLVPPPLIERTSGEWLAKNGLKTFACSETQKFGHVTFFWNGNRSGYFNEALETYVEIPSDNVPFNQAPLMKAREITAAGKEALLSGKYDVVRVNYANPDMVGHTGDMKATVAACEECDACVKELLDLVEELGGMFLVTADHGNADDMVQRDKKGNALTDKATGALLPLTSHTLAPVPVAIGGPALPESVKFRDDLPDAGLANVTATYINLMGFQAPAEMEPSLIA
ncbi:metalloenzyme [Ostreococcus tauri]|uniref:phosphoglycerate mutase (2,3-diphosphoglycerate-independent) n=1 Tax=Ostreococcus tauri TaxID=70448 RepID=A0A1Y5IFX8_OSTTA|nr:metalloenzyme [Ostreococcus tauri]